MAYFNTDGLYIKTGREEGALAVGGTYRTAGPLQCTEVKMTLVTDAPVASAIVGSASGQLGTIIPGGVRIEAVEVITETAVTSGGSATLDVGLVRLDRTTEIDNNGLVAALAIASFNAVSERTYFVSGVTGAGALIGTTTANPGYIVANYGTAAFTAGKTIVRVYWYRPQTNG